MHVVIGILTAVAGLIWALVALQRAGISLNSFNPFLWHRRRQWQKLYAEKPLYTLDKPLDVTAMLLLGVAKCEGAISAEQKAALLEIYQREFHLEADEAADLLLASAHLIRNEIYLVDNIDKILEPSKERFTAAQITSLTALMQRVARLEGAPNQEQERLIEAIVGYFQACRKPSGTWETERS